MTSQRFQPGERDFHLLRDEYRRLAAQRPLFAPHADTCFETLENLGQGGMGTVLRIKDRRLEREAALKILTGKPGDQARARFSREARVTARLAHPSIPPVYEAGETAEGQLYLLMKVIEGQTLDVLIKRAHSESNRKASRVRALLDALLKVCEALAYAHSQGIIHRDIKPENLMVGRFGEVMVVDWGVARDQKESARSDGDFKEVFGRASSLDLGSAAAGLTRGGAIVGTLGYMAPEQARGDEVDARSDIFAFGVTLTEVLTGEAAVPGESSAVKFVATLDGRVRGPRDLNSSVSRELDFIARRCLAHDSEERWASCRELLEALKAALNGEPVPGYRYSPLERALRAARRRPGWLVTLSMAVMSLALGALFYAESRERRAAELQARLTRAELTASKRGQAEAKAEARRARQVLTLFNAARDMARRGAPGARVEDMLSRAVAEGGRSLSNLISAAEVCAEGRLEAPRRRFLEEAVSRHPPAYEALMVLHALETEGELDLDSPYKQKIITEAERRGDENEFVLLSRAFERYERKDFAGTIALCDEAEKYSEGLWLLYAVRASSHSFLSQAREALADYDRAIALNPRGHRLFSNRGTVHGDLGDRARALADYSEAVALEPRTDKPYNNRGRILLDAGRLDEALRDFNKALDFNPKYALALINRGLTYARMDKRELALKDYDRVIVLEPNNANAYADRGSLHAGRGDVRQALADYARAIALNPKLAHAYMNRGNLLRRKGKPRLALVDYDRSLSIEPRSALAYNNRGLAYGQLGELERALADFEKALELNPRSANAYFNRGQVRLKREELGAALADFNQALVLDPELSPALYRRGELHAREGRKLEAIQDLRAVLRLEPRHPKSVAIRAVLARLLQPEKP